MKRMVVCVSLIYFVVVLLQFFSVFLGNWLYIVSVGPMAVVLVLQYFRPLEAILTCALVGGIVDLVSGVYLGINMLALVLLAVFLGATSLFHAKPERLRHAVYVCMASLAYRLGYLIIQLLFLGKAINVEWYGFILGPLADGLLSFFVFRLVMMGLVLAGTFERADFYGQRLHAYSV